MCIHMIGINKAYWGTNDFFYEKNHKPYTSSAVLLKQLLSDGAENHFFLPLSYSYYFYKWVYWACLISVEALELHSWYYFYLFIRHTDNIYSQKIQNHVNDHFMIYIYFLISILNSTKESHKHFSILFLWSSEAAKQYHTI